MNMYDEQIQTLLEALKDQDSFTVTSVDMRIAFESKEHHIDGYYVASIRGMVLVMGTTVFGIPTYPDAGAEQRYAWSINDDSVLAENWRETIRSFVEFLEKSASDQS